MAAAQNKQYSCQIDANSSNLKVNSSHHFDLASRQHVIQQLQFAARQK
jgi:hypothetical protein